MPAESAEAYAVKVGLDAVVTNLLNAICKDVPAIGHLQPYLLAKLCELPGAPKVEADAKVWTPYGKRLIDRNQLTSYLEDLRWFPTQAALMEMVMFKRPNQPVPLMVEMLVKGDLVAEVDVGDEDAAAAKMQALQRGKKARKEMAAKKEKAEKKKQDDAAAKLQSVRRGQADRKATKERQMEAEKALVEAAKAEDAAEAAAVAAAAPAEEGAMDPEQEAAAAKMQAMQRGKKARDEYLAQRKERDDAAVKMQAVQRGQTERKARAEAARVEKEQAAAATKMQALQRGKNARKK